MHLDDGDNDVSVYVCRVSSRVTGMRNAMFVDGRMSRYVHTYTTHSYIQPTYLRTYIPTYLLTGREIDLQPV